MDIEGCEWDALLGSKETFQISNNIKAAICVYHTDFDEQLVSTVMEKYGMSYTTTDGYMYYPFHVRINYDSLKLHRGVLRAWK